jgi:hypothetical protein
MCISYHHDSVGTLTLSTVLWSTVDLQHILQEKQKTMEKGVKFHWQDSSKVKGNFHPDNYYLHYFYYKLKKKHNYVTAQPSERQTDRQGGT